MYEFCSAALPWVALGVVIAVYAAFAGNKIPGRPAGACMGFFGGIVLASILGINLFYGMLFGITAGLLLSGKKDCSKAEEQ